jgi:hypothetical protein
MTDSEENRIPPPEVWSLLDASLSTYQDEHEELLAAPTNPVEETLRRAMDELQSQALSLVTTGEIPDDLDTRLSEFQPGTQAEDKVLELLAYDFVHHRIEFDAAREAVQRLAGLSKRIPLLIVAFAMLLGSKPSPTAVKYFRRAATLFLAGYDSEVVVMCGALLEAAMAARFPDDVLRRSGLKPAYHRTGVFSLGQRMHYEEDHPVLAEKDRARFWQIVNWRNDAMHVQPDIGPKPAEPLLFTARLLGLILPKTGPSKGGD